MGCTQYSDQPYLYANQVVGNAKITCFSNPAELQLTEWLNKDRWYGEETIAGPATSTDYNYPSVSVGLAGQCISFGLFAFRNPANGAAEDYSGNWYYGSTTNSNRFNC